jgi:hypothetical protein
MKAKTQFQRWYGGDESNRVRAGNTVASELGTHLWVSVSRQRTDKIAGGLRLGHGPPESLVVRI